MYKLKLPECPCCNMDSLKVTKTKHFTYDDKPVTIRRVKCTKCSNQYLTAQGKNPWIEIIEDCSKKKLFISTSKDMKRVKEYMK